MNQARPKRPGHNLFYVCQICDNPTITHNSLTHWQYIRDEFFEFIAALNDILSPVAKKITHTHN